MLSSICDLHFLTLSLLSNLHKPYLKLRFLKLFPLPQQFSFSFLRFFVKINTVEGIYQAVLNLWLY
jgi:hypothetical protein